MLHINTFAKKIFIEDNHEFITEIKDCDKHKSFIIWQKVDENLAGLLFKGSFDFPPTIEGRFFVPSDFYCNKDLAIIGKNLHSLIIAEGGISFIDLFGKRYEVIGVVGYNYPSNIDNSIYFNLDSNILSNIFYIDGKNSNAIAKVINDFSKNIPVITIDDSPHGIGRLFGFSNTNLKITIACILICFLIIILSINFFVNANYSLIINQHLFGTEYRVIVFKLMLQLCIYLVTISLIGILVSNIILFNILAWQGEKSLPGLLSLLGIFYLFTQIIGTSLYTYVKIGRMF